MLLLWVSTEGMPLEKKRIFQHLLSPGHIH